MACLLLVRKSDVIILTARGGHWRFTRGGTASSLSSFVWGVNITGPFRIDFLLCLFVTGLHRSVFVALLQIPRVLVLFLPTFLHLEQGALPSYPCGTRQNSWLWVHMLLWDWFFLFIHLCQTEYLQSLKEF
jgi:hypothetical protein